MDNQEARAMLRRYTEGIATEEEKAWVETWYNQFAYYDRPITDEEIGEAIAVARARLPRPAPAVRRVKLSRTAIAAAIAMVSIATYLLIHRQTSLPAATVQNIVPGSNKAILTLADGSKINLSTVQSGIVAHQNTAIISKDSQGNLVYQPTTSASHTGKSGYNTITTPRGGQWPAVILPDGSKVILDAASSIKYPVSFSDAERSVEVTGQVYFEVAHRTGQSFKVSFNGQTVKVLGTKFNVYAYPDEPVHTTLVEGKVSVTARDKTLVLQPGQSAVSVDGLNTIEPADVDAEIAWINGETSFKHHKLKAIMRQISRWYDIDVEYQGDIPDRDFNGGIRRNASFQSMLKILELNDIHYELTSGKLIIKP